MLLPLNRKNIKYNSCYCICAESHLLQNGGSTGIHFSRDLITNKGRIIIIEVLLQSELMNEIEFKYWTFYLCSRG